MKIIHKVKMTSSKEGNQCYLFAELIKLLSEKVEEKELVSFETEEFMEKVDTEGDREIYKPTGQEEIRIVFHSRKKKDEG